MAAVQALVSSSTCRSFPQLVLDQGINQPGESVIHVLEVEVTLTFSFRTFFLSRFLEQLPSDV